MNSPRFPPAGLLVGCGRMEVMLDGGPGAVPDRPVRAWLLTDERAELGPAVGSMAKSWGLSATAADFSEAGVTFTARAVAHTSHPVCGYLIEVGPSRVVWAPEFWTWPDWAATPPRWMCATGPPTPGSAGWSWPTSGGPRCAPWMAACSLRSGNGAGPAAANAHRPPSRVEAEWGRRQFSWRGRAGSQ